MKTAPSVSGNPIGFFDSGIGGLSVWRKVIELLPHEHTIYYADTAFCPYGAKTPAEIIARSEFVVDFLLSKHVKLIVVACNTATAAAIKHLRKTYPIPFVAMEPAVKPAGMHSQSGVIGVLATQGTLKGRLYQESRSQLASHVKIIEQAGDGLVEAVEAGDFDSPNVHQLLEKYINPMLEAGADHIVLGCSHYPFLIPAIQKITGNRIHLIDPAPAVAQRVKVLLEQHDLLNKAGEKATYDFFSSGNDTMLKNISNLIVSLYP